MVGSILALSVLSHPLDASSPKGRAIGKPGDVISSPEALPLGELARQRLRGRAIYNFKKQEHYT